MKEQLRGFIVDNFLFGQPFALSDDDSLQEAGIIDSTGVMELVTYLEVTFGVSVADQELLPENLDSINRLLRFLQEKLASAGHPAAEPLAAAGMTPQAA